MIIKTKKHQDLVKKVRNLYKNFLKNNNLDETFLTKNNRKLEECSLSELEELSLPAVSMDLDIKSDGTYDVDAFFDKLEKLGY